MSPSEIANRPTGLYRQGKFEQVQKELFAEDAVSGKPLPVPVLKRKNNGAGANVEKEKKLHQ